MSVNKIREVKSYATTDDKRHDTLAEAVKHQRKLDFKFWHDITDDLKVCSRSESVDADDLVEWLEKYKAEVLAFYGEE